MISIIIPTYNRGYTLKRSIDSVLNQTFHDFELIIVDDCSTDNTEEIINGYSDNRIKYIKQPQNYGANKARNVGIENSKFDYIAFQDSDDEWLENKLEVQFNELIQKDVDIVSCSMIRVDKHKESIVPDYKINSDNILDNLMYENFISTQTILGKKKCFIEFKFDEELPRFQDWDLVIRLAQNYKINFIEEPLVKVYVQEDSITKKPHLAFKASDIMYKKYSSIIEERVDLNYHWIRSKICYADSILKKTEYLLQAVRLRPFSILAYGTYIKSIYKLLFKK